MIEYDKDGHWYDENGYSSWRNAWNFLTYYVKERKQTIGHWKIQWGNDNTGGSGFCQHCPHVWGDHVADWKDPKPNSCTKCDCSEFLNTPYRSFGISCDTWDHALAYIFRFGIFSGSVYFW